MIEIVSLLNNSGFTPVLHDLRRGVPSGDALFIAKHLVGDFKCTQMPEMRGFRILSFKQKKYFLIRIGIPARLIQRILFVIRKFMKNYGL
jgi:hypothetical protein